MSSFHVTSESAVEKDRQKQRSVHSAFPVPCHIQFLFIIETGATEDFRYQNRLLDTFRISQHVDQV